MAGVIWSFDLGAKTGFAYGKPGEVPRSGTVGLKRPDEPRCVAYSNLIAFLQDRWTVEKPWMVVKEAAMPLQAFKDRSNSQEAVMAAYGYGAIVEGMAVRFGLYAQDLHPATIRKHFCGSGRLGDRATTKRAVVERCHILGYFPRDCWDDNRGDACAMWDFAASTYGRMTPRELHLFNERVA